MKRLEILKTGASLIVSVGVGAIVGNVIKTTTPADTKKILKICIDAGGLVLTGLAGDMAGKYTDKTIDDVVDAVKDVVKEDTTTEAEKGT